MNTRKAVIENILLGMKQRNIPSENQLAKRARVDQKTINNLMNPEQSPSSPKLDTLEKIAKALNMTVSGLCSAGNDQSQISDPNNYAVRISSLPNDLRHYVIKSLEAAEYLAHSIGNSEYSTAIKGAISTLRNTGMLKRVDENQKKIKYSRKKRNK